MKIECALPMKILKWVYPEELLSGDQSLLKHLWESLKANPFDATIEDLLDDLYEKRAVLWTWGTGVLMTSTMSMPRGVALLVTNVAGKDYLSNIALIDHDLTLLAKNLACKWIYGQVENPGLVRVYAKRGARPLYNVVRTVN